ncbi:7111_t:CDS:2, partial [Scutellospora calospora]
NNDVREGDEFSKNNKVQKDPECNSWPITCLITQLELKHEPILDLFDYYYENKIQIGIEYHMGDLEQEQREWRIETLLGNLESARQQARINVLLHKTSLETSHSSKMKQKFSDPYYVHNVYGNGAYKLRTINQDNDKQTMIKRVLKKPVKIHLMDSFLITSKFLKYVLQLRKQIKNTPIEEIRIINKMLSFYDNNDNPVPFHYTPAITTEPLEQAKISLYLSDLWSIDTSDQIFEVVSDGTWEGQITYLRDKIRNSRPGKNAMFQYYYLLGERLEEHSWSTKTRQVICKEFTENTHR